MCSSSASDGRDEVTRGYGFFVASWAVVQCSPLGGAGGASAAIRGYDSSMAGSGGGGRAARSLSQLSSPLQLL